MKANKSITGQLGINFHIPISESGIGIRSLHDIIEIFFAKLWWQFRTSDSIWTRFMKAKYSKRIHHVELNWSYKTPIIGRE